MSYISSNTYDPSRVDTSAKWRPTVSTFPYSYIEEEESDEEISDGEFDDDRFLINKKWKQQDSGDFIMGDPQTFGRNFHGIAYENVSHRSGISPIAGLYKNMDGPPIGTGGSGQAFRTTGNFRRTGTVWGYSNGNVKSKKRKNKSKFRLKDFFNNLEESDCALIEHFFLRNKAFLGFNI